MMCFFIRLSLVATFYKFTGQYSTAQDINFFASGNIGFEYFKSIFDCVKINLINMEGPSKNFWKNLDLKKKSIPDYIIAKKDSIVVKEGIKEVDNIKLFYREALPAEEDTALSLLMLHGKMFSSKTWLDLGTLHIMAAAGFRTVAVDLPGFGQSPAADTPDRATFLSHILDAFGLRRPVVVSPSLSGLFSLSLLIRDWRRLAGFVPVAPVGTQLLEDGFPCSDSESARRKVPEPLRPFLSDPLPDLSVIQTPTMVVYGERDRSRSSALLSLLPVSQCQEIPNGGHPAYLDNPQLWHTLLYNYMLALEKTHSLERPLQPKQ